MIRIYKRKGSKNYYGDFRIDGRRKRKPLGVTTLEEARAVVKRLEVQIALNGFGIFDRPKITFGDFCTEYLEITKSKHTERTHEGYWYTCNAVLLPLWGDRLLHSITTVDVEIFMNSRRETVRPATVNKDLRHLRAIFSRAVVWKYLSENPAKGVSAFKQNEQHETFLDADEIDRVIRASGRLRPLIVTAINTGLRSGELYNLRWQDVDFDGECINVTNRVDWNTKNHRNRSIPMSHAVQETLVEHRDSRVSGPEFVFRNIDGGQLKDVRKALKKIEQEAGVNHFTLHDLRRTFASHLVFSNTPISSVKELMGHRDISTTAQYTRTAQAHLRSAINSLSYGKVKQEGTKMAHPEPLDSGPYLENSFEMFPIKCRRGESNPHGFMARRILSRSECLSRNSFQPV